MLALLKWFYRLIFVCFIYLCFVNEWYINDTFYLKAMVVY